MLRNCGFEGDRNPSSLLNRLFGSTTLSCGLFLFLVLRTWWRWLDAQDVHPPPSAEQELSRLELQAVPVLGVARQSLQGTFRVTWLTGAYTKGSISSEVCWKRTWHRRWVLPKHRDLELVPGLTMLRVFWCSLEHPKPGSKEPFLIYLHSPEVFKKTISDTPYRILFLNMKPVILFSSSSSTKPSRPRALISASHSPASSWSSIANLSTSNPDS